MQLRLELAGVFALALGAGCAAAQSKLPQLTVAQDSSAQYKTLQEALNAAPETGAVLHIKPGTYREKLRIEKNGIQLRGEGKRPEDVVLVWGDSAEMAGGTGKSFSLSVTGDNFVATNLTIQNDWEKTHDRAGVKGAQAVALYLTGDRAVLRHVRLLGYQDTLYAASKNCHTGGPGAGLKAGDTVAPPCLAARQLYEDCYIEGHVDFIFGDAKSAFNRCELHALKSTNDMFTAQSRQYEGEDSGYLFRECTLTADPGAGHVILGRPWRAYATVYFINTKIDGVQIAPEGWGEWDGKLATSTYGEYNTGPGADVSRRAAPSKQLTAAEAAKLTVAGWLSGPDHWNAEALK